jgi:hypothetical protein
LLPEQLYTQIVNYIQGQGYDIENIDGVYPTVDCGLAEATGSIDITFWNTTSSAGNLDFNVTIAVPFSDLAVPVNGKPSCSFGISRAPEGQELIFGDAFMRSIYIIYELQNEIMSIAQAVASNASRIKAN